MKPQPPGSVSGARGWLDGYNGPYPSLGRRFHSHQPLPFSGPFSCSQVREDGPGRTRSPGPNGLSLLDRGYRPKLAFVAGGLFVY